MKSNSPSKKSTKSSYHHGDLRRSLIDAAARLANKVGIEAVTLRGVAQLAGVSHSAPYHHFKNKADMLYAVAEEGFERLDAQLAAGTKNAARRKNPDILKALGHAYVAFAVNNAHFYRVMFRPELARSAEPEPESARVRAYERLIEAVQQEMDEGGAPSDDCMVEVLRAWCTMHGLASLWLDNGLSVDPPFSDWGITTTTSRLIAASAIGRRHSSE